MKKETMGGSCLLSCQFEIRVVGGVATCHSKNGHYKMEGINYISLKYV